MVFFIDPGIVDFDKSIPLIPNQRKKIPREELAKWVQSVQPLTTDCYFAANEPNYPFDESMKKCIDNILEKVYVPGPRPHYMVAFTSDYNNHYLDSLVNEYPYFFQVYFFFQGYLSVQWFRNYRLYSPVNTFDVKLCSMSRIIDKLRSYRIYLTSKLVEHDLIDGNHVSCSDICPHTKKSVEEILKDEHCFLNTIQIEHINNNLQDKLPLRFDHFTEKDIPNTSYEIDWYTMSRSFLHIVNETVFYEDFNHLTEKTFKPIVLQRPFLLASTPGSLAYLKKYGFKTFGRWIDESYDQETDHQKRLDMIALEAKKICDKSIDELHEMYQEMKPILEHNRNLFYGSFEQDILDELVSNYQSKLLGKSKSLGMPESTDPSTL